MKNSVEIFYGVLLAGKGQILAKDLKLQIVDESVAITDINYLNQMYNYLYAGNYEKAIPFLEKNKLKIQDIDFLIFHPGGKKIVQTVGYLKTL